MLAAMERAKTTRVEAMRLITALIARQFAGPLPALSTQTDILDGRVDLERLPLAETLPLHGQALFASAGLAPEARQQEAWTRESFFGELGAAVGVSARELLAAVRMKKFPLAPPRAIAGHEYLGLFRGSGRFDVADPCHLRKSSRMPAAVFSLSSALEVRAGSWHVFVRPGEGDADGRTAELAVIHEDGFDVVAAEHVATIGVDAGMGGVFDRTCPVPDPLDLHVEGVVHGLGAFSYSGYGDGMFPVFAGRLQGEIIKLRIAYLDERPEVDATVPRRALRRYAVATTFAIGDMIEHVKFGEGMVIRVADGKIVVQFAAEERTLVHAKG